MPHAPAQSVKGSAKERARGHLPQQRIVCYGRGGDHLSKLRRACDAMVELKESKRDISSLHV